MAQHPPAWMEALVDVVAECLNAHSPMGPLGFRYLEEEAHGELVVYPTPVELVGGAEDGTVVVPGFALDLHALLAAFEHVTALQWCAHGFGPSDPDGPCVSLEGLYQGHDVWLRELIRDISQANPTWGSPQIVGELRKLGIDVVKSTVETYRVRPRKSPSPTWKIFLHNHPAG